MFIISSISLPVSLENTEIKPNYVCSGFALKLGSTQSVVHEIGMKLTNASISSSMKLENYQAIWV